MRGSLFGMSESVVSTAREWGRVVLCYYTGQEESPCFCRPEPSMNTRRCLAAAALSRETCVAWSAHGGTAISIAASCVAARGTFYVRDLLDGDAAEARSFSRVGLCLTFLRCPFWCLRYGGSLAGCRAVRCLTNCARFHALPTSPLLYLTTPCLCQSAAWSTDTRAR